MILVDFVEKRNIMFIFFSFFVYYKNWYFNLQRIYREEITGGGVCKNGYSNNKPDEKCKEKKCKFRWICGKCFGTHSFYKGDSHRRQLDTYSQSTEVHKITYWKNGFHMIWWDANNSNLVWWIIDSAIKVVRNQMQRFGQSSYNILFELVEKSIVIRCLLKSVIFFTTLNLMYSNHTKSKKGHKKTGKDGNNLSIKQGSFSTQTGLAVTDLHWDFWIRVCLVDCKRPLRSESWECFMFWYGWRETIRLQTIFEGRQQRSTWDLPSSTNKCPAAR